MDQGLNQGLSQGLNTAALSLSEGVSFGDELKKIYHYLYQKHDYLGRISVALYEPERDVLKTFAYASEEKTPLAFYEYKLSQSESLSVLVERKLPRIIEKFESRAKHEKFHTKKIKQAGFQSSYTYPMFYSDNFLGMIFFNSKRPGVFTEDVIYDLNLTVSLLSLMVANEKRIQNLLMATVHSTLQITREKDPETKEHLGRVAHYARLIAQEVAPLYELDDEFVEHIFMFAPMHDIGKISIPDAILLKPGSLTPDEFDVMKMHTVKGDELISMLLKNFNLEKIGQSDMIRNIVRSHHEMLDGSGYPDKLLAEDIPVESRIIAVADIFDALTSERPYKSAWSNEEAMNEITSMAEKGLLDSRCVNALINQIEKVEEIQVLLAEEASASSHSMIIS